MIDKYPQWIFEPLGALTFDERQQWLDRHYVTRNYDSVLHDPDRSVVIFSTPGHGVSTSLNALEHYHTALASYVPASVAYRPMLLFRYNPNAWPGMPKALYQKDSTNHFPQIMVNLIERLLVLLKHQPQYLSQISLSSHEFIVWMVRHYLTIRRGDLWLRTVEQHTDDPHLVDLISKARAGEYDNLHSDDPKDGYLGQIDECITLITELGRSGIYALIELDPYDWNTASNQQKAQWYSSLHQLFEDLSPVQTPRFGYKIAIPAAAMDSRKARSLIKDRAEVVIDTWEAGQLQQVASKLLSACHISGEFANILKADDWRSIEDDSRSIWGTMGPAAIALIVHWVAQHRPAALPLSTEQVFSLRKYLYSTGAKLRYAEDEPSVVWRGHTPILLDQAHIGIFQALWHHSRVNSAADPHELAAFAGSNTNVDKIISRIRARLEPFKGARNVIYLTRSQSGGVQLHHCQH